MKLSSILARFYSDDEIDEMLVNKVVPLVEEAGKVK